MSSLRFAFSVMFLAAGFAGSAAAQGAPCSQPFDPACNHLKCYKIKDKPITGTTSSTQLLRTDDQFGREVVFRLQPVLLCLPMQKSCCVAGTGCSPANCQPDPVPAPALPHFKCYRVKAKSCADPNCTRLTGFPKGKIVNLRDQFGPELNVPVGNPVLICAPVDKVVVGVSTTTTTTTTSTTSTTIVCQFDPAAPNSCSGACPATAPPGSQCQLVAPNKCDCVAPPVCCECGSAGCFDTTAQCPPGCPAVPDADCNAATGQCACGFCAAGGTCLVPSIPCSANQPCPQGSVCDPVHCPRPCGGPCDQPAGQCTNDPCFRPDGTAAQCRPTPFKPCDCCGPTNAACTTDFDCCSGVCNAGHCQ